MGFTKTTIVIKAGKYRGAKSSKPPHKGDAQVSIHIGKHVGQVITSQTIVGDVVNNFR